MSYHAEGRSIDAWIRFSSSGYERVCHPLQVGIKKAGSGAKNHVPASIVKSVRESISVPLAVGGGIRDKREVEEIFRAGANLIILGNGCESDPGLLADACKTRDALRKEYTT